MQLSLQLMCLPNSLLTQLPLLVRGSKGRSASSVETADILVPSALHDVTCFNCQKKGHFQRVCRGRALTLSPKRTLAATWNSTIPMVSAAVMPSSLTKSTTVISINRFNGKALVDSGSSESFIHPKLAQPPFLSTLLPVQYRWQLPLWRLK